MATHPGDRLEDLLVRSGQALEEGKLEEALAAAKEACKVAPRSVIAHCAKAEALQALDRLEDALEAFEQALALDRNDLEALWGSADLLINHFGGEPENLEDALALTNRGVRVAKRSGEEQVAAELLFLEGLALASLGDPRAALERLDQAKSVLGDDPELLLERGATLFELCRFDEAALELAAVLEEEPDLAWAHYYLGLIHERQGDQEAAEARFEKARELEPEDFPDPIRLSEAEFDQAVEDALAELPEQVRAYLSNVAIAVEPFPPVEEIQGPDPLSPLILGVFRGSPRRDQSTFDPWSHFPNSIVLYQRNLERFASDRDELIEEIGITLLHEVGHFLGFDEDDLRERNLH